MSKSVVTATTAARAKALTRNKANRGKDENQKHNQDEVVVPQHANDDAQALHAAQESSMASDGGTLAGDFSFSGVMADAAASASMMDVSAESFGAGISSFAQDADDSSGGGMFGGESTPILIGAVIAAGLGVAAAVAGGDDDDGDDDGDGGDNTAPTVTAQTAAGNEDAAITGKLTATDADGDALTFTVKGTAPAGFTLNKDGSYTLDGTDASLQDLGAGETRDVKVDFTVSDGTASTDSSLTIKVTGVNDAPTADATQAITTDEEVAVTGTVKATDVDGDTLTYAVDTAATNGTATVDADGKFTYTPNADFDGTDSFSVKVSDGNGGTVTQTVNVTVNNVGASAETIAVAAAGSNTDADDVDTTYNVALGTYNYTISGFDVGDDATSGDVIVGPAGATVTVDNPNPTDDQVVIQFASAGQVTTVTLTDLADGLDAQIFGPVSFNTVFGGGALA